MSNFLKGFSDADFNQQQNGGTGVQYIKAPSAHVVTLNLEYVTSGQKGTPGFKVTFTNADGATANDSRWITENGFAITKQFVAKVAEEAGLKEALKDATNKQFSNEKEWVETIASVLNGAQVGIAFRGREYVNDKAEVKVATEYWYAFAPTALEAAMTYVTTHTDKNIVRLPQTATTADFSATAKDPFAIPAPSSAPAVDPFAVDALPF